ncbi:hypothetical protein PAXRUDRAFT_587962 [Paxillus rubicundulus Ve08.2h10]|uniref:G domain-containing protein n=1 Tax=Paxillus rubicundulus Ve08.2h10 TaxID=930991 RepID=A0A0D0E939_9AGAM|nr:hypothetical protein PAXRUDRAFT_587962 [Paxillus rubicundulus Ve08.2h10]
MNSSSRTGARDPHIRKINIVLFGEAGVGKSSVINLIAGKEVAGVSADADGYTVAPTPYDITLGNNNIRILDTAGLGEPQLGVDSYLAGIEKTYQLIQSLIEAGGLHLLLFCMRGDRMTKTKRSNYQFFYEFLCHQKVPLALVFTGLERETVMEDWWRRNASAIEKFGIRSVGHACITAVRDDTPGHAEKYAESEKTIRELLVNCALEGNGFHMDSDSWLAVMGGAMTRLIPGGAVPKQNDIVKVLTKRCGLDLESAKRVAKLMRDCGGKGGADVIAREQWEERARAH